MMRYALTPTDALFGFQKIVQAAWFFPGRIDPEILRSSLAEFGIANPIFCGRVSRKPRIARNFTPRPPFSDYEVVTSAESGIPLSVGSSHATLMLIYLSTGYMLVLSRLVQTMSCAAPNHAWEWT